MQAPPQMDGSFPASGMFRVIAMGASGANNALVWNGKSLVLGSGSNWTIEQVPMAMAGLSMENIGLYPFSEGPLVSTNPRTGWQRAADLEH